MESAERLNFMELDRNTVLAVILTYSTSRCSMGSECGDLQRALGETGSYVMRLIDVRIVSIYVHSGFHLDFVHYWGKNWSYRVF